MKNIVSKRIMAVSALLAVSAGRAFAAGVNDFFSNLNSQLGIVKDNIEKPAYITIGAIGVVFVVINLIKYFKGDQDGKDCLIRCLIGALVAVVLIAIFKAVFFNAA